MAARRTSYWAEYEDGRAATPRGPKGFIESTAAMISHPQTGAGKKVCIMKSTDGTGAPTGFCYVEGQRVKTRKRKGA